MKNVDVLKSEDDLFHYTKRITGMEYIINNKQIMMNPYSKTNDPYEYRKRKFASVIDAKKNDEDIALDIIIKAEKFISNSKILCFCRNVVDRKNFYPAYQKTRMWSQYGDDHRGFCLVFSKNKLLKSLKSTYENVTYGNVSYLRDKENVNIDYKEVFIEKNKIETTVSEYIIKHIIRYKEDIFLKKYVDYRDEDEFRTVVIDEDERVEYIDIRNSIKAIIIGDRFPEIYKALILSKCKEMNINLFHYKFVDFESNLLKLE